MRELGRALAVCLVVALAAFLADALFDEGALPFCDDAAVACGVSADEQAPDRSFGFVVPCAPVLAPTTVVPPPSFLGGAPLSPSRRLVVCRRA
ncbi:MAG: hypothetical protein ABFD84_14590 [Candidatus Polarisedimenticolia bacterium]|nr:hypothetical protein [bacterium]